MKRRMLCGLLALVLCAGLLPAASLAAEAPSQTEPPVTENSEAAAPEGTTSPEGSGTSDTTDSADTSDTVDTTDTDTSDATDVTDDADPSDDTDTPDDTDPSDDVDTADDTDSADVSDEVQSVVTTARVSDGEGTTATATSITLGETVTSGAAEQKYVIALSSGLYYIRMSSGNISIQAPNSPDPQECTGGVFAANSTGNYNIQVPAATTFTIVSAANATDTEIPTATTGTAQTVSSKITYKLTAGTYALAFDASGLQVENFTSAGRNDKFWTGGTTIVNVPTGQIQWLQFTPIGASGNSSFTLTKAETLAADRETTISASKLYSLSMQKGWFVLEYSGCTVQNRNWGGGASEILSKDGKIFIACSALTTALVSVTPTNGSGSIKLRAMEVGEASEMTAGTTCSAEGLYRFSASTDGYYTIEKTDPVSVYTQDGDRLEESYVQLSQGDVLYVSIPSSASCTVKTGDTKTLKCGDVINVNKGDATIRYSFTAETSGVYCFGGSAVSLSTSVEGLSRTWEWSSGSNMLNGYRYIPLTAGEMVYFYIGLGGGMGPGDAPTQGTVKFDAVGPMHQKLNADTLVTASGGYQGYTFTPTEGGLYVIEANGSGGSVKMLDIEGPETKTINGTMYYELEGGKTYYFSVPDAWSLKVAKGRATALALDEKKTTDAASVLYSYVVVESGFYTLTGESIQSIQQYDESSGIQNLQPDRNDAGGMPEPSAQGPQTYTVALTAGTTVYFAVQKRGSGMMGGALGESGGSTEMSLTISKASIDNSRILEAKKYASGEVTPGMYVFTASESGMYVLSGAQASILAAGNANAKRSTELLPALFYLEKGQQAQIKLQNIVELEIALLNGSDLLKVLELDVAEELRTKVIFSFTAPEDGLYLVEVPEEHSGMEEVYFMDAHLRQRMMCKEYDETYIHRSFVCNLQKGETVYVWGLSTHDGGGGIEPNESGPEMGGASGAKATVRVKKVNVSQALGAIGIDQQRGLNSSDTREAVQELGTDNLTEAMTGSDANEVVDKMGALEDDVSDSTIQTDVVSDSISSRVSVVGAKLNTLTKEIVTLRVEDGEERTLPADVDWSEESAIHLTMDLDGVVDADSLAVPVCITLAVPESMDPEKVRLVHYGAERTEILEPIAVYEEDGVWYARFVVGGFSPFALAELAANDAGGNTGSGTQNGHSPKTGDENRLLLWAAVLLLACGGVVLALKKKHN